MINAMKQFLNLDDLSNFEQTIIEGIKLKKNPNKFELLGNQKTLGMLFFNPSLRTRLSTQKAAQNLEKIFIILRYLWTLIFFS